MRSKCGNVLPLVLGLLLVLSILVTSMLRMPGTLRRNVSLVTKETQEMYFAESAVLAKLNGFPDGYFAELPIVGSRILGPWTEWSVRDKFQFMLGSELNTGDSRLRNGRVAPWCWSRICMNAFCIRMA